MKNNRKLIVYGSITAVLLVCFCVFLFFRLFSNEGTSDSESTENYDSSVVELLKAVPMDAVAVFMVKNNSSIGMKDKDSLELFNNLWKHDVFTKNSALLSLHYSSKNEVSALFVTKIPNNDSDFMATVANIAGKPHKDYNGTVIYVSNSSRGSSYSAYYNSLFLNSKSPYVVEAAIRHLDNEASILDNSEFKILVEKYGHNNILYINHSQIGKFFSGCIEYNWLKYSDFIMRMTRWSVCSFDSKKDFLNMTIEMLCESDEKNYVSVFLGQEPKKTDLVDILPASTLFFCRNGIENKKDFNKKLKKFLEVYKKNREHDYKLSVVSKDKISPDKLSDSLGITEVASAWCRFGDTYEWLNFVKVKGNGLWSRLWKRVTDKDSAFVKEYPYKGYLGTMYGNMFSYAKEDFYTKLNDWYIIGNKDIVELFASGDANYYSFAHYLEQTSAKSFLGKESVSKMFINLVEASDSIAMIVKNPIKNDFNKLLSGYNFGVITIDMIPNNKESYVADCKFYLKNMEILPVPRVKEVSNGVAITDSTVTIPIGPFILVDFINGGDCYLEQQSNNKLSYLNGDKKRQWTIDFPSQLTGMVKQADLYNNGKLQMIFMSEDKLYALDRLGRFVNGFPKKLDKKIVLGPEVLDIDGNKNYTVIALAEDNSIIWRNLKTGAIVNGWKDIHSNRFVKVLPEYIKINGSLYWIVRNACTIEFYNRNGEIIEISGRKKVVSPDSKVEKLDGTNIKVTGIDGKDFAIDLATGKTKNL